MCQEMVNSRNIDRLIDKKIIIRCSPSVCVIFTSQLIRSVDDKHPCCLLQCHLTWE